MDEDAFHWEVGKHFYVNNAKSYLKVNLEVLSVFAFCSVIWCGKAQASISVREELERNVWAVRCLHSLEIWLYACVHVLWLG